MTTEQSPASLEPAGQVHDPAAQQPPLERKSLRELIDELQASVASGSGVRIQNVATALRRLIDRDSPHEASHSPAEPSQSSTTHDTSSNAKPSSTAAPAHPAAHTPGKK